MVQKMDHGKASHVRPENHLAGLDTRKSPQYLEYRTMGLAKRSQFPVRVPLDDVRFKDMLYPVEFAHGDHLPRRSQFEIFSDDSRGRGILAKVGFSRGTVVARFTGQLMSSVLQHTLQVSPTSHVHDPHFIGLLSHSCAPNCLLDMTQLELLALTDIAQGSLLTVDYALTEDILYRQFPCNCGAGSCRKWITGRRESVNAEGHMMLLKL